MPVRARYQKPPGPNHYPAGFVAPIRRAPLTPWLSPYDAPAYDIPHLTPNVHVHQGLPPEPTASPLFNPLATPGSTPWVNPVNLLQPPSYPDPRQTPVFPTNRGLPWSNAVVGECQGGCLGACACSGSPAMDLGFGLPGTPAAVAPPLMGFSPYFPPVGLPMAAAHTPAGMMGGGALPAFGGMPSPGAVHLANPDLGHTSWVAGVYPPEHHGQPVPLQFHPSLTYNPVNGGLPILEWDVGNAPESALAVTGRHCYKKLDLGAAATTPEVKKIYIDSDALSLRWWMKEAGWGPIVVENAKKVTVGDLLRAIWMFLQMPLTREEVKRVKAESTKGGRGGPDHWHNLNYAKHLRCQQSPALYHHVDQQGFKRIDLLGNTKRFQGLRFLVFETNEWKAYLGLLSDPTFVVRPPS